MRTFFIILSFTLFTFSEQEVISVPTTYELDKQGRDQQSAPPINWGKTTGKKRVLFIVGASGHGHGTHEYRAGSILLANALNASGLPVVARVHYFGLPQDQSVYENVDTIVFMAEAGGKLGAQHETFDTLHKKGTAMLFVHYTVHPKPDIGEKYFKRWIGGYYDDNQSVNPHWVAELTPKAGHPVGNGIEMVKVFDELYWNINTMPESPHHYALAQATPTPENMVTYGGAKFWNQGAADKLGTPQSLLWCVDPEEGPRGAGFSGGHFHRNWAIDGYRKLILNTIVWLSRGEVPKDGVPSRSLTEEDLNKNLNRPTSKKLIKLPTEDLLNQKPGKAPNLKNN